MRCEIFVMFFCPQFDGTRWDFVSKGITKHMARKAHFTLMEYAGVRKTLNLYDFRYAYIDLGVNATSIEEQRARVGHNHSSRTIKYRNTRKYMDAMDYECALKKRCDEGLFFYLSCFICVCLFSPCGNKHKI